MMWYRVASPLVGARARQALKWPCLVREFASISVQTQARRAPARKAPVAGGKEQADESLKDALPEEVRAHTLSRKFQSSAVYECFSFEGPSRSALARIEFHYQSRLSPCRSG